MRINIPKCRVWCRRCTKLRAGRAFGSIIFIVKEVSALRGNNFQAPEVLKIKGYKYRAKMLIAGAVLLLVVILILSLIIHGIASAVRGAGKEDSTDTAADTDASVGIVSSAPVVSDTAQTDSEAEAASSVLPMKEERFDADNKLIIDTDTLDGKKAIAITFDDGPSEYTAELISQLDSRSAKATFFMVGSNVSKYPEAVNMMVSGGHQLGNHTYDHTDIAALSGSSVTDTIARTDSELLNVCGQKSTAFRPPYGSYTESQAKALDKTFTLWSLDTLDWKARNADKVKAQIVNNARDGSIILLHDLYKTSVDGAVAAIDELQSQGFVFVTVDELMTRYGYPINPGAHSAQYAVYETNSPHADEYRADEERDRLKDEAASQAANTFYYDRRDDSDTDTDSAADTSSVTSYYNDEYVEDYDYYGNEDYGYEENAGSTESTFREIEKSSRGRVY